MMKRSLRCFKMKEKVKCAICEIEGEIEVVGAEIGSPIAVCEFCYLNMKGKFTTNGKNKFYIKG